MSAPANAARWAWWLALGTTVLLRAKTIQNPSGAGPAGQHRQWPTPGVAVKLDDKVTSNMKQALVESVIDALLLTRRTIIN